MNQNIILKNSFKILRCASIYWLLFFWPRFWSKHRVVSIYHCCTQFEYLLVTLSKHQKVGRIFKICRRKKGHKIDKYLLFVVKVFTDLVIQSLKLNFNNCLTNFVDQENDLRFAVSASRWHAFVSDDENIIGFGLRIRQNKTLAISSEQ